MKINIYYGGRGMIDDPAIAVIGRITSVLDELRVNVEDMICMNLRVELPHCHRP